MYINDVDKMATFCRLYADDNSADHSSDNLDTIERLFNYEHGSKNGF